jgi:hypothetical protein
VAEKTVVHSVCPSKQAPSQKEPKPKFTVLEWIRAGFRFPGKARLIYVGLTREQWEFVCDTLTSDVEAIRDWLETDVQDSDTRAEALERTEALDSISEIEEILRQINKHKGQS